MNKQIRIKNTLQILLATILMCVGFANAQVKAGEITGSVIREDGSAIPGVSIVATSINLISKAISVTNVNGIYQIQGIPTGYYKVVFSLEGFQTITKTDIQVDLSKTHKLDVIMSQ